MVAIAIASYLLPANANGQATQTAAEDTTTAPVPAWTLKKDYDGGIRGGVSDVSMRNRITAVLIGKNGVNATSSLGITVREFRLQNKRSDSKRFLSSVVMPFRSGIVFTGNLTDNRIFDRVVTVDNRLQDFRNDTQAAEGSATYIKIIPNGTTIESKSSARVTRSDQTFEKKRTVNGAIGAAVRWSKPKRVNITGRGSFKLIGEQSETSLITDGVRRDVLNKGLGGDEDSLVSSIKYWIADSTTIKMDYTRFTKTREFMDLPRGVLRNQQFQGNLKRETETRTADLIRLQADMVPLKPVMLKVTGEHTVNHSSYAIDQLRFNETTRDRISGLLTYRMPKNINFSATLENDETFRNLGEGNTGNYTDKRRSFKTTLDVPITQTMRLNAQVGTTIIQTFYENNIENPKDRDQLEQFANVRLNSTPFPKITAQLYMAVKALDYVSLDAGFSSNNRRETTWDFRPEFTYDVNERIKIRQTYGINLALSEFDFAADDNFLDRDFAFSNTVSAKMFPKLSTEVRYALVLHDRGSYLTPVGGGERLLDITQEDRRDEMGISFRYAVTPRITVVGKNNYSQRQDDFSTFTDDNLSVGVEGKYDWGGDRRFNFRINKVNKFGGFIAEKQKDYWEMDSSLAYKF
jgi:hypothetical protein